MEAGIYRAEGYRVSLQVSQQEIDRAENDVINAYICKVCVYSSTDIAQRQAVMQLASILLMRRAAVATRSGGKVKQSPNESVAGYPEQCDLDNANRLLRSVQTIPGRVSELVDDICGVYYRNVYLGL